MGQVFHGKDRENMTPCQRAFEKWCNQNRELANRVNVQIAWQIFLRGYWAGEEDAISSHEATS